MTALVNSRVPLRERDSVWLVTYLTREAIKRLTSALTHVSLFAFPGFFDAHGKKERDVAMCTKHPINLARSNQFTLSGARRHKSLPWWA